MEGSRERPARDPNWEPSEDLKAKVHYLAWRWSLDRPEVIDDLYQEGLLAIWLREETHAPLPHQMATARQRMWVVRQQGKSVDGRLNARFRRPQEWLVFSLDLMVYGYGAGHRVNPVEDYVIARLTVQEILGLLTPGEQECLGLVYQGFTQREIARRTGYPMRRIQYMMASIREKVWPYLHGQEVPDVTGLNSDQRRYPEVLAAAAANNMPWTEEEDRILLERAGDTAYEVALAMGRTIWAIRHRRSRLRKR